jgi:DNA-binding MarR family transcriptional regulator
VEAQILAALEAAGPMTTRELAARLGMDTGRVYRVCKKLEAAGQISSTVVKTNASRVYFYPMTREVMTGESFERIGELTDLLRSAIQEHGLPEDREALVSELQRVFQGLYARSDLEPYREAIQDFEEELLAAAESATKRGDVTRLLGIRQMRPNARRWALSSGPRQPSLSTA